MPLITNQERRRSYRWVYMLILLILLIGIPIQVFPYLWMLSGSVKNPVEIFAVPPSLIPKQFELGTYKDVLQVVPFLKYFVNSMILSLGTVVLQGAVSALAAYSLSKLRPRGSRGLLLYFLGTLMVPNEVILISTYVMMSRFPIIHVSLLNSFWSVLLPFSAWAWALFLLKGFFDGLPEELLDAARIDGASEMRIFTWIVLPLSRPVLAVVGLQTFMAVYNQFIFPLVMLPDPSKWPLMVALYNMQNGGTVPWNDIMAGLMMATVPVMVIYLFAQRYLVQGITLTGLKG